MVSNLCKMDKELVQILDVGCGPGYVGQYLKQDGYANIDGMDKNQQMLNMASENKAYDELLNITFGDPDSVPNAFKDTYDFVIASSLVCKNHEPGMCKEADRTIFENLLYCTKVGGYVIFAAKQDHRGEDQYKEIISILQEQYHWKFVSEHQYSRFYNACDKFGRTK